MVMHTTAFQTLQQLPLAGRLLHASCKGLSRGLPKHNCRPISHFGNSQPLLHVSAAAVIEDADVSTSASSDSADVSKIESTAQTSNAAESIDSTPAAEAASSPSTQNRERQDDADWYRYRCGSHRRQVAS